MIEKGVIPEIQVGIFSGKEIVFTLNGVFFEKGSGKKLTGRWTALRSEKQIKLTNAEQEHFYEAPADFIPLDPAEASLVLHGVLHLARGVVEEGVQVREHLEAGVPLLHPLLVGRGEGLGGHEVVDRRGHERASRAAGAGVAGGTFQ